MGRGRAHGCVAVCAVGGSRMADYAAL